MGKLIDADKFLERVKKDREHEIYLHSWTADMVLERLDSWYAPTVEAIPKADYEARLKADIVAMLTEILLEIEENGIVDFDETYVDDGECIISVSECNRLIQQKIDKLKGWNNG